MTYEVVIPRGVFTRRLPHVRTIYIIHVAIAVAKISGRKSKKKERERERGYETNVQTKLKDTRFRFPKMYQVSSRRVKEGERKIVEQKK